MTSKAELRTHMRALRRRLAANDPEAGRRLSRHLADAGLPPIATYSLYHPVGSELDPQDIRFPGATMLLPVVVARDAPLVFRAVEPGVAFAPDALGIPAPPPGATELEPDIVFAPVLAFDRSGGRLGQGAGFYDRTLADLRSRRPVMLIGVAYAGQEVDHAPTEAHDVPLDAILTETGLIRVARTT